MGEWANRNLIVLIITDANLASTRQYLSLRSLTWFHHWEGAAASSWPKPPGHWLCLSEVCLGIGGCRDFQVPTFFSHQGWGYHWRWSNCKGVQGICCSGVTQGNTSGSQGTVTPPSLYLQRIAITQSMAGFHPNVHLTRMSARVPWWSSEMCSSWPPTYMQGTCDMPFIVGHQSHFLSFHIQ